MKAGKVLKYFIKLAISGILALIILSAFCLIYFNPPMTIPQPEEYSNSKSIPDRFWINMREGFAYGRTNAEGYNDAAATDTSAPLLAFVGSSHTVAIQIQQEESFAQLTENMLREDGNPANDIECINVASGGQAFNSSISNLEYLAKSFDNLKYVVIETSFLSYSEEQLAKMVNGDYHVSPSGKNVIYEAAQSIPYLRLLANQYRSYIDNAANAPAAAPTVEPDYASYERGFRIAAEKMASIADEYGFELIILHHSNPSMNSELNMESGHSPQFLDIHKRCCEDNGIRFVDVCEMFARHYNESYEYAYGFANTKPNTGHLNVTGHRIIAQALYEEIMRIVEVE